MYLHPFLPNKVVGHFKSALQLTRWTTLLLLFCVASWFDYTATAQQRLKIYKKQFFENFAIQ